MIRGHKGSGKGIFLRAIADCFGAHAMQLNNREHVVGKFNSHQRDRLFLFADEAFWAGDKAGEQVLKGLITEPALAIEQKGVDAVQWPNRLKIAMAANADWVVPASEEERRYAVFNASDKYVIGQSDLETRTQYFKALAEQMRNGGLEAMLWDMLHFKLGDWHPREIYETEALRQLFAICPSVPNKV